MATEWTDAISPEISDVEKLLEKAISNDSNELTEICRHVVMAGGKRIRPAICILAYYAAGGKDPKEAIKIGAGFELAHCATLIHDDINDQSEIRRGRKSLHKEFSVTKAILAGDYLLVLGFNLVASCGKEIVKVIMETASDMARGELLQNGLERDLSVTEKDYYNIIKGKTAMLISAAAMAGVYLVKDDKELLDKISRYSENLGMAFQIIDDTLDVVGNEQKMGKMTGSDLIENKPTLPIIFGMQDKTHGKRISELFSKKQISKSEVSEGIELIKKTDSIERCRKKAAEHIQAAIDALDGIPESKYKESLVSLAEFVKNRDR